MASAIKDLLTPISDAVKFYVTKKYTHDSTGLIIFGFIVSLLIGAIIALACLKKMTEPTSGAILGSLIGDALGKFSNNNGRSDKA